MVEKRCENKDWFFKDGFDSMDLMKGNFKNFKSFTEYGDDLTSLNKGKYVCKKSIIIETLDYEYYLVLEGINHYLLLFVNGVYIPLEKGIITKIKISLDAFLMKGENELCFIIDDLTPNRQTPQNCFLEVCNHTHFLEYYFRYDNTSWFLDYLLSPRINNGKVSVRLYNEKEIINQEFDINEKVTGNLGNVSLWDCDNPHLYTLELTLIQGNIIMDKISQKIGFRYIKFVNNDWIINTKKSITNRIVIENFADEVLDFCDQHGVLVINKLSFIDSLNQDLNIEKAANLIVNNRHHPSIIAWQFEISDQKLANKIQVLTNLLDPDREVIMIVKQ